MSVVQCILWTEEGLSSDDTEKQSDDELAMMAGEHHQNHSSKLIERLW